MTFKLGKVELERGNLLCLLNQEIEDLVFYSVRSTYHQDPSDYRCKFPTEIEIQYGAQQLGLSGVVGAGYGLYFTESESQGHYGYEESMFGNPIYSRSPTYYPSSEIRKLVLSPFRTRDERMIPKDVILRFIWELKKVYNAVLKQSWPRSIRTGTVEEIGYEGENEPNETVWLEKYLGIKPPISLLEQVCADESTERFAMLEYGTGRELPPPEDSEVAERFGMLEFDD